MEYISLVSVILTVFVLIYYLYVRSTIHTWGRERLLRKEESSMKEAIDRYQQAVKTLRSIPLGTAVIIIILLSTWKFAAPELDQFWTSMALLLAPLPVGVYLLYRTFVLMLRRSEELYAEE